MSSNDLTWKAFSCFTTFSCSLWTFAVSSDKLLCSWRPLIATVVKLPPTLDFRSGMDIICGYASEPPTNSTQSLNSILSNQSHRSTYRSQIKLSKLNRISLTQKRINDSLKDVGDLICSSQSLWSPLLSATSEHLSMKMKIPTIHCVHLICGSRRKCHAPTTTINCSLRLKRWTGGETTCEAIV